MFKTVEHQSGKRAVAEAHKQRTERLRVNGSIVGIHRQAEQSADVV